MCCVYSYLFMCYRLSDLIVTGELLCYSPAEGCWRSKRVAVRSGQLLVGSPGDQNPRLALRRLNLTPGPATHSFALRRSPDTQPLLTFQVRVLSSKLLHNFKNY